jgi:hypothetical protein
MKMIRRRNRRKCGFPRRPWCPSRTWGPPSTDCEVPDRQLAFLDPRAAPILTFESARRQKHQCSRLLSLPLDVLELIFAYLLIAPAEIYLGIVALGVRLPHHWHPAHTLRSERYPKYSESSCGETPVCRHRRAEVPLRLCRNLLLVNRQLHVEAARILYGHNAFAIDLCVPGRQVHTQHYEVSKLALDHILPLNPVYHKLLRRVSFRHYNYTMNKHPVRVFHSTMMHLLRDMPGAFTAFRRNYANAECSWFAFETFAGWAPTGTPTWLADASTSLATSPPLITTTASMHLDEVHSLMSTLWKEPVHSDHRTQATPDDSAFLDLCVMSDQAVHAATWRPDDSEGWQAARIFLVRLRNNESKHLWPDDRIPKWYSGRWYSRLQTWMVGKSKGLQHAPTRQGGKDVGPTSHCMWRDGPKGNKRLVFTAPMSLLLPPVCRFLRGQQLKRDHRLRCDGDVNVLILPIESEASESYSEFWDPFVRPRFPYVYV